MQKIASHSTKPRNCTDLVNSSFSSLLTSADFDMKEGYPNTALHLSSCLLHRGDAHCSTAVKPFCCVWKEQQWLQNLSLSTDISNSAKISRFSTEAWSQKINKNYVSATRSINYVKCSDASICFQVLMSEKIWVKFSSDICSQILFFKGVKQVYRLNRKDSSSNKSQTRLMSPRHSWEG